MSQLKDIPSHNGDCCIPVLNMYPFVIVYVGMPEGYELYRHLEHESTESPWQLSHSHRRQRVIMMLCSIHRALCCQSGSLFTLKLCHSDVL